MRVMKTKVKSFLSLILICLILAGLYRCKKDDPILSQDYRDKYIGNYHFNTYVYKRMNFFYTDPPRVTILYDTIDCIGNIIKIDSFKLKITFIYPYSEPDFTYGPYNIDGLIYPTLSDSGTMSYPEMKWSMTFFNGKFFSKDSVIFGYGFYSHAGNEFIYTLGKKIN